MRRAAVILTLFLILWLLVGNFVVPPIVEQRFNRVASVMSAPSLQTQELHRRLLIADLHADSLLWGRDLLRQSTMGHVDVPRLERANVAVQVFSIVTKVPKRLNTESNSSDSDLITQLALAEAWSPTTWFSLKARALYQSQRLHSAAARSRGQLVLIRTRSDLEKHLAARALARVLWAPFWPLKVHMHWKAISKTWTRCLKRAFA